MQMNVRLVNVLPGRALVPRIARFQIIGVSEGHSGLRFSVLISKRKKSGSANSLGRRRKT